MSKKTACVNNTLEFTQAQIQKEVRDGVVKVMNSGQVGQAYKNQLYNQPSLSTLAISHWKIYHPQLSILEFLFAQSQLGKVM